MIYYTADLHMGHENVIRHCGRPFTDAEEMDAALVRNWNNRIHRNDAVYIVGDLFFRNSRPVEGYLEELKGHKHLILGNHDLSWYKKADAAHWAEYFESIQSMVTIRDGSALVTLCHYPMMTWNGSGHGGFMVFGHIHNNTSAAFWPLIRGSPLLLNAGVDINDYRPVPLSELQTNNAAFKAKHAPVSE